jgi:hypothetical protein
VDDLPEPAWFAPQMITEDAYSAAQMRTAIAVAHGHPLAQRELAELYAEIDRLRAENQARYAEIQQHCHALAEVYRALGPNADTNTDTWPAQITALRGVARAAEIDAHVSAMRERAAALAYNLVRTYKGSGVIARAIRALPIVDEP